MNYFLWFLGGFNLSSWMSEFPSWSWITLGAAILPITAAVICK